MALEPSPTTLAEAQRQLAQWMAALEAASTGQSYSIDGQTVTRQTVTEIRAEIRRWHNTVNAIRLRLAGRVRPLGAQVAFPVPGTNGGDGGAALYTWGWTAGVRR